MYDQKTNLPFACFDVYLYHKTQRLQFIKRYTNIRVGMGYVKSYVMSPVTCVPFCDLFSKRDATSEIQISFL